MKNGQSQNEIDKMDAKYYFELIGKEAKHETTIDQLSFI